MASVLPFLVGLLYTCVVGIPLKGLNVLMLFVALLCIDMATTGLNHYMDYKRAVLKSGYHFEVHNPLGNGELTPQRAKTYLIGLLALGASMGILLSLRIDWLFFMLGVLGFGIGITYSYGPLPISRTFLGEAFSGVLMGLIIPFATYYASAHSLHMLSIGFDSGIMTIQLNIAQIGPILWLSMPLMLMISGIMLANNICDCEEDIINNRFTLPVMIGTGKAKHLYSLLVLLAYGTILAGMMLSILPMTLWLVLLGVPVALKFTHSFIEKPSKAETFAYAVKNFIVLASLIIFSLIFALISSYPLLNNLSIHL